MGNISPKAHQRKSGGWEVVYYYDTDDLTGKRKKITTYGKTKSEAEGKMKQKIIDLLHGNRVEPNKETVGGWFQEWLTLYAKPKVKQSTYVNYRSYIEKRIVPELGHLRLSKLKVDHLQRFLNQVYAHGNFRSPGQPVSPKTIRNLHLMIHSALEQAYKNGLIPKNYAEFVSLPKTTATEMRVLSKQEHQRLIKAIHSSNERWKIGILICLSTGIRAGELCGLQWQDIDFDTQIMKIRRTLGRLATMEDSSQKTELVIGTPKSKNSMRNIPIPDFLVEHLQQYRFAREMEKLDAEDFYDNRGFILCNEVGMPVEPRTLQDVFKRLLKEAEISDANFHSTRHTFATRAIEAGMDVKTLSMILGHADVSTTLNRYAHVLDDQKRAAMALINSFYEPDVSLL